MKKSKNFNKYKPTVEHDRGRGRRWKTIEGRHRRKKTVEEDVAGVCSRRRWSRERTFASEMVASGRGSRTEKTTEKDGRMTGRRRKNVALELAGNRMRERRKEVTSKPILRRMGKLGHDETKWTEVRRRKATTTTRGAPQETTYFVTNIPPEARKGDIRHAFEKLGKLSDVYMADKIGKNGKHYAFVRFREVNNTFDLEKKMDGTIIKGRRLEVNLAKHGRKESPRQTHNTRVNRPAQTNNAWRGNSFRDNRTFVDITRPHGIPTHAPPPIPPMPPLPTPIQLHREQETHYWLCKTSLVGDTASLAHLGHLPNLLNVTGEIGMEIKYIGGLKVLILFDNSLAAKAFLAQESRWKEHFKWLE
ncbi:hypothetical protein LXL04_012025 [Taraxacum kok-saghyz]